MAGRYTIGLIALLATACPGPVAMAQVDLAEHYRATLDFSDQPQGYDWTCEPTDVWQLKTFLYRRNGFSIRLGPSQVVFGCHEGNALWAVILPEKPGKILAASSGKGEPITSVWLRFNPAMLGQLFPASSVEKQGDPEARTAALRIAEHKMRASWQANGKPMVPSKNDLIFDLETDEGVRRFYAVDTKTNKVQYIDAFRQQAMPAVVALAGGEEAVAAFDAVWEAFDREYAMFAIKPQVDWRKLRDTYRPRAEAAKDNRELAGVIAEMLAQLEDLHVFVKVDGQFVPGYNRERPLNANIKAVKSLIGPVTQTDHDLAWGRTEDGVGYVNVYRLGDAALPQTFDETLEKLSDVQGLILDLRFNGGGSEPLGCQIAGRFLDKPVVYSMSQYRCGPKHSDLTRKMPRQCGPAGPWHFRGPVVVLQGQKTISSAESFALAMAQCPQVVTMGDRTAGSSGNPRQIEVGQGIVVNLPRWIDLDPEGNPIDAVGVRPKLRIDAKPEEFRDGGDPVLSDALENVRGRIKKEAPPDGGALQRRAGQ